MNANQLKQDSPRWMASLLATVWVLAGGGATWAEEPPNPHAWQRWDHALTSPLIQVAPAPAWAGEVDRQHQRPFTEKTCSRFAPPSKSDWVLLLQRRK